jgi:hypothetical protein
VEFGSPTDTQRKQHKRKEEVWEERREEMRREKNRTHMRNEANISLLGFQNSSLFQGFPLHEEVIHEEDQGGPQDDQDGRNADIHRDWGVVSIVEAASGIERDGVVERSHHSVRSEIVGSLELRKTGVVIVAKSQILDLSIRITEGGRDCSRINDNDEMRFQRCRRTLKNGIPGQDDRCHSYQLREVCFWSNWTKYEGRNTRLASNCDIAVMVDKHWRGAVSKHFMISSIGIIVEALQWALYKKELEVELWEMKTGKRTS